MTNVMTNRINREEIISARRDRLRGALRSNLKRRKAQVRSHPDRATDIIEECFEEQSRSEKDPSPA